MCSVALTLCDPKDCSPPGSSVHGILQARILELVAMPIPEDLPNPGVQPESPVSCIRRQIFLLTTSTWEARAQRGCIICPRSHSTGWASSQARASAPQEQNPPARQEGPPSSVTGRALAAGHLEGPSPARPHPYRSGSGSATSRRVHLRGKTKTMLRGRPYHQGLPVLKSWGLSTSANPPRPERTPATPRSFPGVPAPLFNLPSPLRGSL